MQSSTVAIMLCATGCSAVFPLDLDSLPFEPTHVPDAQAFVGDEDVTVENVRIDTEALTITPPVGVELERVSQVGGGPELALLRGRNVLMIGDIKVVGTRSLVVFADHIDMLGNLDVSADGITPGPGGNVAMGRGVDGIHVGLNNANVDSDSGGGGGSHGTEGGTGGDICIGMAIGVTTGGAAGSVFATETLEILQGGSAGGDASQTGDSEVACPTASRGGGGGGAVQLSARFSIAIDGVIDASGGGGEGGVACMQDTAGSGSGGGAGGAVFIEARSVTIEGTIAANGGAGGGGGGANRVSADFAVGGPGADGGAGPAPALGGVGGGPIGNGGGTAGGTGAVEGTVAITGVDQCNGQTGGGGGGLGRIAVRGQATIDGGTFSPAVFVFE